MESLSKSKRKPQHWTTEDVQKWLSTVVREYDLTAVDASVFKLDGQQLSDMTVERFLELDPNTGDILYAILRSPSTTT